MSVITEKDLKKWKKLAYVVTGEQENSCSYYADEILSYVCSKLEGKEIISLDNYVFISLKNRYFTLIEQEKSKQLKIKTYSKEYIKVTEEFDDFDEETYQDIDDVVQCKLESIYECYDKNFNTFEKQLYFIYFVKGLSERNIVEKTGISRYTIRKKIKEIKNKIIKYYDSKNNK